MRLTKYEPTENSMFPYRLKNEKLSTELDSIHKLGCLEDIEEELGVDLITYFKIKNAKTVFVKELGHDVSEMLVRNSKDGIDVCYKGFVNIPECDSYLRLKDYGKTWALTKEELE